MPQVLTTNATIKCPHLGEGTSIPINAVDSKWIVDGGVVLLDNDIGTLSCGFVVPCATYQLRSMRLNATFVDGRRVMLVTDFIQSVTGFPLIVTERHPVFDNSTPAPIPAGGAPAPTPPELQETDQPTVVAAPPTLPFSLSAFATTSQPAALAMTFALRSQFPRFWILSMLNVPPGRHRDITNGDPSGILVVPAGGVWATPETIVTVTLTGATVATFLPGTHYFVLTAVNHRGKSSFAQVILTVSP